MWTNSPISKDDKERLINDLKQTAKDIWIIWIKLLNPVINFIKQKYDTFSPQRKQQIEKMVKTLKDTSSKWLISLKTFIVSFTKNFIDEKKSQATEKINETKENISQKTDNIKQNVTEKFEEKKQEILDKKDEILS